MCIISCAYVSTYKGVGEIECKVFLYHVMPNRIILVSTQSEETSIKVVSYMPAVKAYRFRR